MRARGRPGSRRRGRPRTRSNQRTAHRARCSERRCMPRSPTANRTSPAAISAPPATATVPTWVGTPTATRIVPAFQHASCARTSGRGGGSVARNAPTKNWPAPSTSCETPPRKARCNASQPPSDSTPASWSRPAATAARRNAMAAAKNRTRSSLGRAAPTGSGRRGQRRGGPGGEPSTSLGTEVVDTRGAAARRRSLTRRLRRPSRARGSKRPPA